MARVIVRTRWRGPLRDPRNPAGVRIEDEGLKIIRMGEKGGIYVSLNVRVPKATTHSHSWPALLRTRPSTPLHRQSTPRKISEAIRAPADVTPTAGTTSKRRESADGRGTAEDDGETPTPEPPPTDLEATNRALATRDVNAEATNRAPRLPTRESADRRHMGEAAPNRGPVGETAAKPVEPTRKRARGSRRRRNTGKARRERDYRKRMRLV